MGSGEGRIFLLPRHRKTKGLWARRSETYLMNLVADLMNFVVDGPDHVQAKGKCARSGAGEVLFD